MEIAMSRRDSAQQPQRSRDSMVMAPGAAGECTGTRGAEYGYNQNGQFCMPQVATVVFSFFAEACRAVRFQSALPTTPVNDPPVAKGGLPDAPGKAVSEDGALMQPSPPAVVLLQRSNAIRYRAHPRPRRYTREDSCLGHHPGGEADSYHVPKQTHGVSLHGIAENAKRAVRTVQLGNTISEKVLEQTDRTIEAPREQWMRHPTRPDSPFPKPQQRTIPPGNPKRKSCTHQPHDISLVAGPQLPTHISDAMDEPRPPPLRGTGKQPSMIGMPCLPLPVQCKGYLLWPNLGTLKIPPGPALASSSSSCRNYATTGVGIPDGVPKAGPVSRRFPLESATSASPSSYYPVTKGSIPNDISDDVPEVVPASRRFSLDESTITEALPTEERFSISDSESKVIEAERRSSIDSRFSMGSSTYEDDRNCHYDYHEDADREIDGNDDSLSSDSSDQEPPVIRGASLCSSSMDSFSDVTLPSLGYYEDAVSSVPPDAQDNDEILNGYLADNMDLHTGFTSPTYAHSESESASSINQSLFANFSGDFTVIGTGTSTSSLTLPTSLIRVRLRSCNAIGVKNR